MRRRAGFTLLEMLGAILLLGIVVTTTTSFYIQLSRESNRAAAGTRDVRRSAAVLDRIARELEGTVLVVKPGPVDPLEHPWIFLGERVADGEGSDHLKFITRANRPRSSAGHASDLAVVTYALRDDGGGSGELVRWTSPQLPEALDRTIPDREDDGAQVLVEDVASFGVRFLAETGEWRDAWDSSSLVDSSRLPLAAELQLALAPAGRDAQAAGPAPEVLRRQVVLPMRPIDLQELLTPEDAQGAGGDDEDEEGDDGDDGDSGSDGDDDDPLQGDSSDSEQDEEQPCVTVNQCVAAHPEIDVGAALDAAGLPRSLLGSIGGQCAGDFASIVPLPGDCL